MTVQISMFDDIPPDIPNTGVPAILFDETNRNNGHLLIATGPPRTGNDWLFLNAGGGVIRCCLPGRDTGVDLTPEQLRVLGRYCLDVADRIEVA